MPPLVAAVGSVAALVGGSGFGALLVNAAIGVGINFAVGAAVDWLTPDEAPTSVASASPTGVELQFRVGSDVAVSALMGVKDTPGQLAFHNSYGNDNEYLQLLFIDGNAEHDQMLAYLVDNAASGLSGSNADPRGRAIAKFKVDANGDPSDVGTPYGWVKYYTGAAGQVADPELVARSNPVGRWTVQCTMTATAYRVVTLRYNPKLFGGSIPQMRAVWRGLKQYDRRKDSTQPGGSGAHRWGQPATYEWTENPATCQDNWRRGIWVNGVKLLGLGVSEYDCFHAGVVAAANVCDEPIVYADTARTLPRYVIGIEAKDGTDPISMMRLFEASMAGYGVEYGGAYSPLPAQTLLPVLTLKDRDRVAGEDVLEQTRMSPIETKTAFHGQYLSPELGYLPDDYDIRFDATAETLEGGRRLEAFDATFVRHREIAATLAEIKVRRDRYSAIEVATYGPQAEGLRPGQVITRESALLGTVSMMVLGVQRQPRKMYRLSLRSWSNVIVPTPTEGFLPVPANPLPAPLPVRLMHPLAFFAVAINQVSGDYTVPAIRVTFTPITDLTVQRVIVKYWPSSDPSQVRYTSSDDPGSGIMVIEGVAPVTDYKLVSTVVTAPERSTSWTSEATVTTGALTVNAEVGDGSITPAKLAQELQNERGFLVGAGEGTLAQRLAEMEERQAEADLAALTAQTTSRSVFKVLKAQNGASLSAVAITKQAIAELQAAFALFQVEVAAQLNEVMAGGLIRIEAQVDPDTATAKIVFKVRAETGDTFGEATLQLGATSNGIGGTSDSWIAMMADRFYFLTTDGEIVTQPFAIEADFVKIINLRFEQLSSLDGTSVLINGVDPEISLIGP